VSCNTFLIAGRQNIAILDVDGNNTFKKEMKAVGEDWTLAAKTGEIEVNVYSLHLGPFKMCATRFAGFTDFNESDIN